MKTKIQKTAPEKIIQILPAQGVLAVFTYENGTKVIQKDKVILWGLTDKGNVIGLTVGSQGLDCAERQDEFRYELIKE